MPLQYVLNEAGDAVKVNEKGLPLVFDPDGDNKEFAIDAINVYTQVPALRTEAKQHREAKEALENKFKMFTEAGLEIPEGDEDFKSFASEVTKALETVRNLEDKKLIEAGEVESIKAQAQEAMQGKLEEQKKSYEKKLQQEKEALEDRDAAIFQLMVADKFNTSKFVEDKLNMTPKMARAYFGNHFKVEKNGDGKRSVIGYFPNGDKIFSTESPGDPADFDECLHHLVEKDTDKAALLAGDGASGGGSQKSSSLAPDGKNPWMEGSVNLTEQGRIANQNPALAKKLAAEAGKTLYG